MILTLRVVALNDQPLTRPITARFDARGGTLGRADHNTMALPDPERHISRQQAQVSAVGQGFVIRNVGSANPIVVGGLSLGQGESAPLRDGDSLRVGGYLLSAELASDDEGATVLRPAADPGLPASRAASPSLGATAPASVASPARTPTPARLPDDFDPFAPPALPATPAVSPAALAGAHGPGDGLFDDLLPSTSRGDSLDDLFGLDAASAHGRDPLAAFLSPAAASVPAARTDRSADPLSLASDPLGLSTDPLALFGDLHEPVPSAVGEPPAAWADDVSALHAAFTPPVARDPGPPPMPSPPPPARPATASAHPAHSPEPSAFAATASPAPAPAPDAPLDASAEGLWRAFCAGAGVRLPPGTRPTPELMQLVGQLLRTAVDGTVQLMALRATTRHELRADVTMIQARNNNPLKFSPDGLAALEQLLQPPLRGFMPAPVAMADAMHDLLGHAVGTMAGTRAALQGVLGRFAPESLERQLAARGGPGAWLPGSRKARLWELYLQHFQGLREEAQEDFHALFGKAFLDAYQQQVEHLAQAAPPRGPRAPDPIADRPAH